MSRHVRAVRALVRGLWVAGVGVAVLATTTAALAQSAPKKNKPRPSRAAINRCVSYDQAMSDDGMHFTLSNQCDMEVSCKMSWTVICIKDDDHPASRHSDGDRLSMLPSDGAAAFADASACGQQGWKVSRVRWSCQGADDQP